MIHAIIAVLSLLSAIGIPLFYYKLVTFCVEDLSMGWVFSTIFLRVLVIILTAVFIKKTLSIFKRTREWRTIWSVLMALPIGFGISFIAPIYNSDYGDQSDEMILEATPLLEISTDYERPEQRHLVAFFDTHCNHCLNVASKLSINQRAGQSIAINAFFSAQKSDIDMFIEDVKGDQFIIHELMNLGVFMDASGFELPSVFLLDRDGSTMKHWAGDVLNYSSLDYLLNVEP